MITSIVMSVLIAAGLGVFAALIIPRFRLLLALKGDNRFDRLGARIGATLKFAIGQWRMPRDPLAGFMHIFIFFGFLAVALGTILHFVRAYAPDFTLPGPFADYYALIKDVFEVLVTIGVVWSMWRRISPRPTRVARSWEGLFVLGMILTLMLTDFLITGAELRIAGASGLPFRPVGHYVSLGMASMSPEAAHRIDWVSWWIHCVCILVFLNFLPIGKHFHVITSIPNVFFKNLKGPGGLPYQDVEKLIEAEKPVGIRSVADLTWAQLLNTYSCTECGRCNVYCPTVLTDKPLSHRQVNLDLKHAAYASKADLLSKDPAKRDGLPPLIDGVLKPETVWACTTCGSCEQECPLFIEQIPRIVGMRQYKVMMEGDVAPELARAFEGMERNSNPWGLGSDQRDAWASGLDIPRAADIAAQGKPMPLLYWVGCAGSYDDRAKKITLATIKILRAAGVDFCILGKEEGCTGDSARRGGNEFLFQTMAKANVELLNNYKVTKILTTCPHCFHTLAVDYRDFGGNYEVVHHAQLFEELLAAGRLKLTKPVKSQVAWHDSCYLGRYHDIYDAPRNVVRAAGAEIKELPRNRSRGVCCGAGGARFWMEEKIGERINLHRSKEAVAVGTDCVGSACPFCLTMLKDGVAELGKDEQVKTLDLAEIVAQAL